MPVDVLQTPLMRFLQANNSNYHGKARELRESVAGWLGFIPASFPHYTRHTIEHSEEIISQMSKLLFENGNPAKPVLPDLSSVEAYILVAAAYLHDSGMTVSDNEKRTILQSAEWREWVESGSGSSRFKEIEEFRTDRTGKLDGTTRGFLADVQLRFLIAEYVRRTHHLRGGDILSMHQSEMGRFGYDDPILIQTIASICVAHGLQQNELNDPERFPERRDVRDEQVNVRLMAVLLRLGDLLDMSYDRACPLLLNAASPIPADSLAHWTQYQRITHKMVAHDKIELTAECQNEEEHRFLHDWCAWLVSELDQARRLIVRSTRHADWEPPMAAIDQANISANTITIRPAKGAKYIPARWRFELDTKAVFDRLIYDALDTPWDFLRELIQNAADATRCQMFADLVNDGEETPLYPTQVDQNIRDRYPIRVTLSTIEVRNELSEEVEHRQVLTVEDSGLGMDQEVIQRYLLQVGRSYYTTRDFRDTFGFVASSRFGIGFLSVFGVSDDVTIETFKPSSTTDPSPLKLRLTGPRSYLLTEKGSRRRSGTSIQVVLRNSIEADKVSTLVANWCIRLEFPVIVNDLGKKTQIKAESSVDFEQCATVINAENTELILRSFPVNREGIEGLLFVIAHVSPKGERWDLTNSANHDNLSHIQGKSIHLPQEQILFHGINTSSDDDDDDERDASSPFTQRIDLRGERFNPTLARNKSRFRNGFDELNARWDEILSEHFKNLTSIESNLVWVYKNDFCDYEGSSAFWCADTDMIPIMENGAFKTISVNQLATHDTLTVYEDIYYEEPFSFFRTKKPQKRRKRPVIKGSGIILPSWNIGRLSGFINSEIFDNRTLVSVEFTSEFIICQWVTQEAKRHRSFNTEYWKLNFDPKFAIARVNPSSKYSARTPVAINNSHPFGIWYFKARAACQNNELELNHRAIHSIDEAIRNTWAGEKFNEKPLNAKLAEWAAIADLPAELVPPFTEVTRGNFAAIGFN